MQGGGVRKGPREVRRTVAVKSSELGAGASKRPADHVPDNYAVDSFAAADHLGAKAGVNAGPGISARIRARIGAEAPGDELVSFSRALEFVRVLSVQTSLQVDDRETAAVKVDVVVVARLGASAVPPGR